jgi:hypothetical protein
MTPKEKAEELIDKFTIDLRPFSEYGEWSEHQAKQCALIAVDEIIYVLDQYIDPVRRYWEEVKLEIQKL